MLSVCEEENPAVSRVPWEHRQLRRCCLLCAVPFPQGKCWQPVGLCMFRQASGGCVTSSAHNKHGPVAPISSFLQRCDGKMRV